MLCRTPPAMGQLQTRTRVAEVADFDPQGGRAVRHSVVGDRGPAAPSGRALDRARHAMLMNISAVVMHAVTLLVEFDASFNRALVVLKPRKLHPRGRDGRRPPHPLLGRRLFPRGGGADRSDHPAALGARARGVKPGA